MSKLKSLLRKLAPLAVCSALSLSMLAGCGSPGPDKEDQANRVEVATQMRSYFDKAGGDYNRLSEADRAEFIKLCGGEEQAKTNWDLMKNGPSRGQ